MSRSEKADVRFPIRARSHLLRLLGDELIGDDRLAVFELVKNGYDADATAVHILLDLDKFEKSRIVVEDNGSGMTHADIVGKWLELATDSKRKIRQLRTIKYNRLPLGEKGVGRLAAFKLGQTIRLITRAENSPEYMVEVDLNSLLSMGPYIEDLRVDVVEQKQPTKFTGNQTGTYIEISNLIRSEWKRSDIRSLFRLVTSLASPFNTPESFGVIFEAPGWENDIKDMLQPEDFLEQAVWLYSFSINHEGRLTWKYTFSPPHWKDLKKHSQSGNAEPLALLEPLDGTKGSEPSEQESRLILHSEPLKGIGCIEGKIFAYHKRTEVLQASNNQSQLKNWLDDQTGIRVYRDGIRVFNYGERNDDWLGLNTRRINTPSGRLGTDSIVSAIHLKLSESYCLKEKTNREGFENSKSFDYFRTIIASVFEHFMMLHKADREAIDSVIKGRSPKDKDIKVIDAVDALKKRLKNHPDFSEISKNLNAIEDQFEEVRDVMVQAGMAGLNLAVVFHEVERSVDTLSAAVNDKEDIKSIRGHIEHLQALLHTFAPLLKKNPVKPVFIKKLVESALILKEHRLKFHKIVLSSPVLTQEDPDFKVKGPTNLLASAIGNLIDNSIFWTQFRKERDNTDAPPAILIKTGWDETSGSGFIAVIDNGTGFSIPEDKALSPFVTKRPGGMGLGLFFANLVMERCGGELTIHTAADFRDEVDFPTAYDGAAVVLRFRGDK